MGPLRTHKDLDPDQQKSIMRMVEERNVALFAQLGSGKTIMALYTIRRLFAIGAIERPVLVVAPIRVIYSTWRQEAKLWEYTQDLKFSTLHGPEKNSRFRSKAHIHLVNYEGMLWLADKIRKHVHETKQFPYSAVVFDESSKMKSWKTHRFKKWKMLMQYFKARYIMTATPRPNSLTDLWSQFYLIDQGDTLGTSSSRFQMTYMVNVAKFKWVPKPEAAEVIQELIAPKTIYMKGKKATPDPHYNRIRVELPSDLMARYNKFEEEFFLQFEEGEVEAFNMASLAIKLRQFVQGGIYGGEAGRKDRPVHWIHEHKIDALEELLDETNDSGMLCAIQFRYEFQMLQKRWPKAPIIYGGVSPSESDQIIVDWNKGKIPLLICHPASMSHGLNLQHGGHTIVWLGLTWSLEQYEQLIGRLDRRGQTEQVMVHLITANKTTDDAVYEALQSKAEDQTALLHFLEKYWKEKN